MVDRERVSLRAERSGQSKRCAAVQTPRESPRRRSRRQLGVRGLVRRRGARGGLPAGTTAVVPFQIKVHAPDALHKSFSLGGGGGARGGNCPSRTTGTRLAPGVHHWCVGAGLAFAIVVRHSKPAWAGVGARGGGCPSRAAGTRLAPGVHRRHGGCGSVSARGGRVLTVFGGSGGWRVALRRLDCAHKACSGTRIAPGSRRDVRASVVRWYAPRLPHTAYHLDDTTCISASGRCGGLCAQGWPGCSLQARSGTRSKIGRCCPRDDRA
jgi:hypothetical protein